MTSNRLPKVSMQLQDNTAPNNTTDAKVRAAATMILVRDQPDGYEVFMIERPGQGAFPHLHVFPGGKVDACDSHMEKYCPTLTDTAASHTLGIKENGLRFWVSAIRECFEECGVLFARRRGKLLAMEDKSERETLQSWAIEISSITAKFRQLLKKSQLTLAVDKLHYFSHWITPESVPTRFDTRFFLAKLPPKQETDFQSDEVVSKCWIQPVTALAKVTDKDWKMILPTLTTLRMLANYKSADDLIAHVRAGYHRIPGLPGKQLHGMQPDPIT